jgi:hypothetical protein
MGEFLLRLILRVTLALVCFRAAFPLVTARLTVALARVAGLEAFFVLLLRVLFFVLFFVLANRTSW